MIQWAARSTVGLGIFAFLGWGQLLLRYGDGRMWGLAIVGVWAVAQRPRVACQQAIS